MTEGLESVSDTVEKNLWAPWCRLDAALGGGSSSRLVGRIDWVSQNRHFARQLAQIEYSEAALCGVALISCHFAPEQFSECDHKEEPFFIAVPLSFLLICTRYFLELLP